MCLRKQQIYSDNLQRITLIKKYGRTFYAKVIQRSQALSSSSQGKDSDDPSSQNSDPKSGHSLHEHGSLGRNQGEGLSGEASFASTQSTDTTKVKTGSTVNGGSSVILQIPLILMF